MTLDLALMVFDHTGGADRAYADVLGASAASPWVHEIALVEHHRPAGLAVGLVGGATAGGLAESRHTAHLHDVLIDEVRAEVPEKSSAVLLLAGPEHVDAMVAAFEGHGGRPVRHHLSPEGAQALEAAVAGRPRV